jgi:hypothetical protein
MPGIKKTVLSSPIDLAGNDGWIGPIDHTIAIPVDLTQFTAKEIDADGFLKPYIPLTRAGVMIGASPAFVYGITVAPFKVAEDNATATIAALGTVDVPVALIACVNRDFAEDILDRVYTANELAGFDRAGSKCVLVDV